MIRMLCEKEEQLATAKTEVKTHELKTDPEVFYAVASGQKTFELRYDDRNFQYGDILVLRRTKYSSEQMREGGLPLEYTGEECRVRVGYVLCGPVYGLMDGWVIMSIEVVGGVRITPEVTDIKTRIEEFEERISEIERFLAL